MESNTADTTYLEIQLLDELGNYQSSIDTLFTQHDSIINLQSIIDVGLNPKIKLLSKIGRVNGNKIKEIKFGFSKSQNLGFMNFI